MARFRGANVDVCVITYRNTADRIRRAVRAQDHLWVRDNTRDNVGFARAANELAAKGTAPLILFVNPDGDPQPGCFNQLEEAFDDLDVVAAAPDQGDEWDGPIGGESWLSGACLAVRRETFEKVGGFDERFFMYGEDVDLSWKLAQEGRLMFCRDAAFLHDPGYRGWMAGFRVARNWMVLRRRWGRPALVGRKLGHGVKLIVTGDLRGGTAQIAGVLAYLLVDTSIVHPRRVGTPPR
jgi:GT2 family glycosyltransferase